MARLFLFIFGLFFFAIISCSKENDSEAYGYIEGRNTYIASSASGILKKIAAERGQRVEYKQLLAELDLKPEIDIYKSNLEDMIQSKSSRDAIAENAIYAKKTFDRYQKLVLKEAISISGLDESRANWLSLRAELSGARARILSLNALIAQSQWSIQQKYFFAPAAGQVIDVYYRLGEYVKMGDPILSMLAPENIKAIFYIPDKNLADIHLNQKVWVACDHCAKKYIAAIRFISPLAEYTPPIIYSEEMRAKLVYRIEAEFSTADAVTLHPGQPISIRWNNDAK